VKVMSQVALYFRHAIFMEFVGIQRKLTLTVCLEKLMEIMSFGLNA